MSDIHYGRKRAGIKKELREKISDWLTTIKDEDLREACAKDVIVTGGSIPSMLMGDKVNDFDVYFKTFETTFDIAKYYATEFGKKYITVEDKGLLNIRGDTERRVYINVRSSGVSSNESDTSQDPNCINTSTYKPTFISCNAITLTDKFQLVTRFYGQPDEIHDNYDFAHAMCYYDYHADDLVLPALALECMLSRTLIYKGSLYPIASVFRTKKFLERGWRISAGQQLKMMYQISELDLTNTDVLREQLTGVDLLYLEMLADVLCKAIDNPDVHVDQQYVCTVIDRIFSEQD